MFVYTTYNDSTEQACLKSFAVHNLCDRSGLLECYLAPSAAEN